MSTNILRTNIEKDTLNNNNYRKVIYTNSFQQVVLMSLNIGEYIHKEEHHGSQFFRIEDGEGLAIIDEKRKILKNGVVIVVPPNTKHYIKNTSKTKPLKLYSIYSPPQHKPNTLDKRQDEF